MNDLNFREIFSEELEAFLREGEMAMDSHEREPRRKNYSIDGSILTIAVSDREPPSILVNTIEQPILKRIFNEELNSFIRNNREFDKYPNPYSENGSIVFVNINNDIFISVDPFEMLSSSFILLEDIEAYFALYIFHHVLLKIKSFNGASSLSFILKIITLSGFNVLPYIINFLNSSNQDRFIRSSQHCLYCGVRLQVEGWFCCKRHKDEFTRSSFIGKTPNKYIFEGIGYLLRKQEEINRLFLEEDEEINFEDLQEKAPLVKRSGEIISSLRDYSTDDLVAEQQNDYTYTPSIYMPTDRESFRTPVENRLYLIFNELKNRSNGIVKFIVKRYKNTNVTKNNSDYQFNPRDDFAILFENDKVKNRLLENSNNQDFFQFIEGNFDLEPLQVNSNKFYLVCGFKVLYDFIAAEIAEAHGKNFFLKPKLLVLYIQFLENYLKDLFGQYYENSELDIVGIKFKPFLSNQNCFKEKVR